MVNSFGILCSPLAINFVDFWSVALSNLVDYMNVVGEYVARAACNFEIYFNLFAFPLWIKVSNCNSRGGRCKWKLLKKYRLSLFKATIQSKDIFLSYISYLFTMEIVVENTYYHMIPKIYYPLRDLEINYLL